MSIIYKIKAYIEEQKCTDHLRKLKEIEYTKELQQQQIDKNLESIMQHLDKEKIVQVEVLQSKINIKMRMGG